MARQFAMRLVLAALTALAATRTQAATTGRCDRTSCISGGLRYLHHYYEELACKPILKEDECCPASYDCSHIQERDKSRCYFKGQVLDVRPDLSQIDPSTCQADCLCRQTKEAGAVAELTCANIECPSLFNPAPPDGCKRTFSGETCCSDNLLCPANTTAETARCEWGGKIYLEGERFYPEEESCTTCVCRKGFDGTLNGPWCRKVTCGLELHYTSRLAKGCAPVFYKNTCCPIDWRCPSDDDVVVVAATSKKPAEVEATEAVTTMTCRWGSLTLRAGESVRLSGRDGGSSCERCTCLVPPHVVCESDGQPCEASESASPNVAGGAVDTAKVRRRRSPKVTAAIRTA